MNFISQMLLQDRFQILSWSGQHFSPGVSQQFWCSFSSSFSTFEDRRRISLKSCPFSQRFAVLARCYPIKLFLFVQFFSSIRSISGVAFSLEYPEAIFWNISSFQVFIFVRSIVVPVLRSSFNQCAISSFSCILMYSSIFVHFSNSFRRFVLFSLFVYIFMVVRWRFLFRSHHINSFVLFNPTGGSWRPSQVGHYIPP